jgi:hypothetical protein
MPSARTLSFFPVCLSESQPQANSGTTFFSIQNDVVYVAQVHLLPSFQRHACAPGSKLHQLLVEPCIPQIRIPVRQGYVLLPSRCGLGCPARTDGIIHHPRFVFIARVWPVSTRLGFNSSAVPHIQDWREISICEANCAQCAAVGHRDLDDGEDGKGNWRWRHCGGRIFQGGRASAAMAITPTRMVPDELQDTAGSLLDADGCCAAR